MKRLVIFDLDGTLANTLPLCNEAFLRAIDKYMDHPLTEEDVARATGLNEAGMTCRIVGPGWESALQDFYGLYEEMHPTWCPSLFEGIGPLLEDLEKAGVILALITGKGDFTCGVSLRQFGLERTFREVITGGFDRNMKAEQITAMLNRYGLKPPEAIYVGDTVSDVRSSREAGIDCISVAWAPTAHADDLQKENAGHVVFAVEDLRNILWEDAREGNCN